MATTVPILANADGDNTIVAAVAGRRIKVLELALTADVAGDIQVKDGASTIVGRAHLAVGHPYLLLQNGCRDTPYYETSTGNALILNTTATQNLFGHVRYELG